MQHQMKPDWIPFAFFPVDKPPGPTSFNAVARVRRHLPKKTKVGHAGTLDPFASGVLLIGIGKATRFMEDVHRHSKTYIAEIQLGLSTDTLDSTGKVDAEAPVPEILAAKLESVVATFTGVIDQLPPIYSAKKVAGARAYDLARRGEDVQLQTVPVTIHDLQLEQLEENLLRCEVTCSTGTYIRSLGRDIAAALGTVGHLKSLRRTRIGGVTLEHCVDWEAVAIESIQARSLAVSDVLPEIISLDLPAQATDYFANGRPLPSEGAWPGEFLGQCRNESEQIVAIYRCHYSSETGCIQPKAQCYRAS
jgi:tRNA pseudouridine55 synthase